MQGIPENAAKNTMPLVASLALRRENTSRVLDIPCGAGAFSQRMLDAGREVHAADIENILQTEGVGFVQADMNGPLPWGDGFFDLVVSIDGIEHLENPFHFVRECRRILRPGGALIVSTPNISAMRSRWRWMMTGHHNKAKSPLDESAPGPLHHINMFSYPRLRYLLHTNGFSIERVETNRVKGASWPYAVLMPFALVATWWEYRREKSPSQRLANRDIMRTLFSRPVYFGETLIVEAARK